MYCSFASNQFRILLTLECATDTAGNRFLKSDIFSPYYYSYIITFNETTLTSNLEMRS